MASQVSDPIWVRYLQGGPPCGGRLLLLQFLHGQAMETHHQGLAHAVSRSCRPPSHLLPWVQWHSFEGGLDHMPAAVRGNKDSLETRCELWDVHGVAIPAECPPCFTPVSCKHSNPSHPNKAAEATYNPRTGTALIAASKSSTTRRRIKESVPALPLWGLSCSP